MKKKTAITFIVELLALFALLIMVITVTTVVLVRARGQSREARVLTGAVLCAQNTAEMTAGASDKEEAADRLRQADDISSVQTAQDGISFRSAADSGGKESRVFDVRILWREEPSATGICVEETIEVYEEDRRDPVYSLTSGHFIKSGEQDETGNGEDTP